MTIEGRRSQLEEAFFQEQDRKLMEKLRELEKMKHTKEEFARISGIRDEAVLQRFVDLNLSPAVVAALSAIPLIEVAWADGHVDPKESEAVLKAAEALGFAKEGLEYQLLANWLTHKPAAALLDAWTHYIGDLCQRLSPAERDSLKMELLDHARTVAEAAGGGFLGLVSRVSKEEKAMLKTLEAAFSKAG